MKKLFAVLGLIAVISVVSSAQTAASFLAQLRAMPAASFAYEMTGSNSEGKVVFRQKGTALVQDSCYTLKASNMEIRSNGRDMWIYNPKDEEIVIQKSDVLPILNATMLSKRSNGHKVLSYTAEDGTFFAIEILSLTELKIKNPKSHFEFDVESLSDDVIVTDIR